jgi:hypothetical protein
MVSSSVVYDECDQSAGYHVALLVRNLVVKKFRRGSALVKLGGDVGASHVKNRLLDLLRISGTGTVLFSRFTYLSRKLL